MLKKLLVTLLIFCSFRALFGQTIFKDYVDGEVYIKYTGASFKKSLRENPRNISPNVLTDLSNCLARYHVTTISRPFYQVTDDATLPYILKLTFTQTSQVTAFISELEKLAGVDYAEKVPLMRSDAVPTDPVFPSHLTQINANSAWNVFNGNSNITVAIIDDAVMWNHVDLNANIYINAGEIAGNNIDDDNNGYVDDVHGYDVSDNDNNPAPTNTLMNHGTHCAGIAGARTDNATGIASIGWNIKIIPVKCQTDGGSVTGIANGYEGIIYAVKAKARVISCSWGGAGFAQTSQAVIDYAWARGSLVIAAAGNAASTTQNYPGAYNNVYCVASVGSTDVKSSFSNYGTWVDISAPGESINSTVPYSASPVYQQMSGTSMATPLVAGLAGLMLSKCPQMTPTDVINCISSTAVNIYTLNGNSSFGSQLGAGRIEAFQAMNCAAGFLTHPPVANFFVRPQASCPGTSLHFSDSSLYAPTNWAWTFQGGAPATSTSSNPVVIWATPGTYSVSLTVSNANGSNTKTKLSYITISAPGSLPFSEGFQNSLFLPVNWVPNNIGNDVVYWQRKTGIGGFGNSNACAMFDNYTYNTGGDRDEMWTPKYDFSNVNTARLRFDVAYARYDAVNSDTLEVRLSTNCGVSWSTIYLKGGTALATSPDHSNQFVPTSSQWRTDSIDISSLTQGLSNVMFSFVNHGQYGQPIYLDNINLAFPSPTLEIHAADTICSGSSLTFSNVSIGAAAYSWDLAGGTPATSNLASPTVTYNLPGTYTAVLTGTNGTASDTLEIIINVNDVPAASVTVTNASCGTCSTGALQAVMISGTAPFSYTWAPSGGNAATAANLLPGCYTVSISGGGCTSTASACVDFDTAIRNLLNSERISVYPNPAKGNLNIKCTTSFSYHLFNDIGQLVSENISDNASGIINLNKFAAGIYLLEISSGKDTLRKKIIIDE